MNTVLAIGSGNECLPIINVKFHESYDNLSQEYESIRKY